MACMFFLLQFETKFLEIPLSDLIHEKNMTTIFMLSIRTEATAYNVEPDHTPVNVAFYQGLHSLQLIQPF